MLLQVKLNKYEKEISYNNNILINQEKYVTKINKKNEKFQSLLMKSKEQLINKENEILLLKEQFEDYKSNLDNYKNIIKLKYQQKVEEINEKLNILTKEIELKDNKIENFEKKYHFLKEKYLKTLNEKKILHQESLYKNTSRILKSPLMNKKFSISQSNEDIFNFITSNSNSINPSDKILSNYKSKYSEYLIKEDIEKDKNDIKNLPTINFTTRRSNDKNEEKNLKRIKNFYKNKEEDYEIDN